jgi:Ca-activated chloride channel family protein
VSEANVNRHKTNPQQEQVSVTSEQYKKQHKMQRVEKTPQANHFNTIPYEEIKTGSLFVKSASGFYASLSQNSAYDVKITGLLARVNLTQTFKNETNSFIEAVYVFPLHKTAAVDALTMKIGNRIINAEIKEKQQAKNIYNKAKKQGKKNQLSFTASA